LNTLKEKTINSNSDVENTIRRFEYIINKDQSLMLKYNQILQAVATATKDLYDTLAEKGLTPKDIVESGVCICDKDFTGFRCQQSVVNDKPHQCYPNTIVPSCNPQTSICQTSGFILRNNNQKPPNKLNEYKSYYCECTSQGTVGVNCEYQRNQCNTGGQAAKRFWFYEYFNDVHSIHRMKRQQLPLISDPIRSYPVSTIGSADSNNPKCNPRNDELCYPVQNSQDRFECIKNNRTTPPFMNYLVFDESNRNPKFNDSNANRTDDKYKRLNISDASTVMALQDLLRDEIMPRYSFNDYSKTSKGPIAILRPSVDMPGPLNYVRNKLNNLLLQTNDQSLNILSQMSSTRVQQLIQDTIINIIAKENLPNLDNLKAQIDLVVSGLNLADQKDFSSPLWNLIPDNFPTNLTNGDPTGLIKHLNALKTNSDLLNRPESLIDVLSLNTKNEGFVDLFKFSDRMYNLLKLDILPGIYIEPDGDLSVRPTPGVFLAALPTDKIADKELFFLPGIFNSVASNDCSMKTLFTPGIMSLPIDSYNLANLPDDPTKYLNKFVPMQLPFNINGFLTPLKSSTINTISTLLMPKDNNPSNVPMKSFILLTPLDFNREANFDIITKNEKFMSNIFSSEGLQKVVAEQRKLDVQDFSSTMILSNPTMLPASKRSIFNDKCLNNGIEPTPRFNTKGSQFYSQTKPYENVTVVPFILYDDAGNPIPQEVVQTAIDKYCTAYKGKLF
jgi:hypothetical protein